MALTKHDIEEFKSNLHIDSNEAKAARDYLELRGLTPSTLAEFEFGYVESIERLPKGLQWVVGSEWFDEKWVDNCVVLPIYSESGNLISFATRPVKGGSWWHWPFTKKNHFFMLNKSRRYIFEKNEAIVMEGYIDGIIAFQEGIKNVVVSMGTSVGYRRHGILVRYCRNIGYCFDMDENGAGQSGRYRSIAEMMKLNSSERLKHDLFLSQYKLPEGEDPDEYIIRNGVDAFLSLKEPVTQADFEEAKKRYWEKI